MAGFVRVRGQPSPQDWFVKQFAYGANTTGEQVLWKHRCQTYGWCFETVTEW